MSGNPSPHLSWPCCCLLLRSDTSVSPFIPLSHFCGCSSSAYGSRASVLRVCVPPALLAARFPDLRNLTVTESLLLPGQQVFPCPCDQSVVMFQFVTSGSVWHNLPDIWVQWCCGWHQTENGFHFYRHEALSLQGIPQNRALPLFNCG